MLSRRSFLKSAATGFGVLIVPPVLLRARPVRAAGSDPVLVKIFLRGGADFMNLVVPSGDPQYYALRPHLAVPAGSVLALDGFFSLHPNLAPLRSWFQNGRLAIVQACGSPSTTRSHFDEQDFIEHAAPGDKTVRTGWLNRYLLASGLSDATDAITLGNRSVEALAGSAPNLAIPSIASMSLAGGYAQERREALEQIYRAAGGVLANTAEDAFDSYELLRTVSTTTGVSYPNNGFALALKDVAALIKADIGVRVAATDLGGWDHHVDETQRLPGLASTLASSLNAFAADLGADLDRTVIVVMTEFGRRAAENMARGTDHGRAAAMLVLGGSVAGGRVLLRDGVWPGLTPEQMFEGMDLQVTTDFRDVFAELLHRHMGLGNLSGIFPSYSPSASQYPGLFL